MSPAFGASRLFCGSLSSLSPSTRQISNVIKAFIPPRGTLIDQEILKRNDPYCHAINVIDNTTLITVIELDPRNAHEHF